VNLLLDTHVLLWWLGEPDKLRAPVRRAIADPRNSVYVSAVSAWEIAIKIGTGKLVLPPDARSWLPEAVQASHFTPLPVTIEHALGVEHLPRHHADPFDRLLISQTVAERLTLVTADPQLAPYGVALMRTEPGTRK
jgi:PIN domain nuclease of toxin-antitoxin system